MQFPRSGCLIPLFGVLYLLWRLLVLCHKDRQITGDQTGHPKTLALRWLAVPIEISLISVGHADASFAVQTAVNTCCMAICTFMLSSTFHTFTSLLSEEEEAAFMMRCRAFAKNYRAGDRPPHPPSQLPLPLGILLQSRVATSNVFLHHRCPQNPLIGFNEPEHHTLAAGLLAHASASKCWLATHGARSLPNVIAYTVSSRQILPSLQSALLDAMPGTNPVADPALSCRDLSFHNQHCFCVLHQVQ